jgi:hypothetical protein
MGKKMFRGNPKSDRKKGLREPIEEAAAGF